IDEAVYGNDHPEVATDLSNLGLVLRELGDLKGARECYGRALAIRRRVYGEEHPKTQKVMGSLRALGQG
ncbi:MAG: tetratricopeptide repeat protein, partial [Anaerolineae bacterium]